MLAYVLMKLYFNEAALISDYGREHIDEGYVLHMTPQKKLNYPFKIGIFFFLLPPKQKLVRVTVCQHDSLGKYCFKNKNI